MITRRIRLRWLIMRARLSPSMFQRYQLGALYARGQTPAPQDFAQALAWYREAAVGGHREARYELGALYLSGQGGAVNAREGLRWLALAAQQDHRQAMRLLAEVYGEGLHGVAPDAERARFWHEKLGKDVFA